MDTELIKEQAKAQTNRYLAIQIISSNCIEHPDLEDILPTLIEDAHEHSQELIDEHCVVNQCK